MREKTTKKYNEQKIKEGKVDKEERRNVIGCQ